MYGHGPPQSFVYLRILPSHFGIPLYAPLELSFKFISMFYVLGEKNKKKLHPLKINFWFCPCMWDLHCLPVVLVLQYHVLYLCDTPRIPNIFYTKCSFGLLIAIAYQNWK